MKITKPILDKESTNVELANIISEACLKGYLDAKKGIKERTDSAILKAVAKSVMSRHKSAIVHAYKAGFAQGRQHK